MKLVKGNREKRLVCFDPEVLEMLYKFISEAFPGSKHGAFSLTVNRAVKAYLASSTSTEAHTGSSPAVQGCEEIIGNLEGRGFKNEASRKEIEASIMAARGKDPRTVRSWMRTLQRLQYVERIQIHGASEIYRIHPIAVPYVPTCPEDKSEDLDPYLDMILFTMKYPMTPDHCREVLGVEDISEACRFCQSLSQGPGDPSDQILKYWEA